jgi:hypothetical protein
MIVDPQHCRHALLSACQFQNKLAWRVGERVLVQHEDLTPRSLPGGFDRNP